MSKKGIPTMTARIGFFGVGRIGFPVAHNLVREGHDVVAFDTEFRPDYVADLEESGGTCASDPAQAIQGRDVIITLLPSSDHVESLVRSRPVRTDLAAGTLWIEMSSGDPAATRRIAEYLSVEHDVDLVDAPICDGGVQGAYNREIALCVGGAHESFRVAKDVLDAVVGTMVHVGPVSTGHTLKLLSNFVAHGICGLMTEMYSIAEASGLSAADTSEILRECLPGRFVDFAVVDEAVLGDNRDADQANFRLSLARKDLRYVTSQAASAGVFSPIAEGLHALYLVAERTGFADAEATRAPRMALNEMRSR